MRFEVRPDDDRPIFRQLVRQITDAIAGGRLAPGARLPSHRELAVELVIAPLTVKKAYDELQRERLIEMRRGRGTFVCAGLPVLDLGLRRERLRGTAQQLLSQAAIGGVPYGEVLELLAEVRREMTA
jgi:GntR family transcriptional regulator